MSKRGGSANKIGERPRLHIDFIRQLAKCKSKKATQLLIANATEDQLLCLVEVCLNLVKDRYLLSRAASNRLRCFTTEVNALARKRSAQSARSCIIGNFPQRGRGFSSIVAKSILPAF